METNTNITKNLKHLLETAKTSPLSERNETLKALAELLCTQDPLMIALYAEQVKGFSLANKTDFLALVKEAKVAKQASRGMTSKPTDDELADRWIKQHPHTVYGIGEFRRYENGIWPVTPKDAVKAEILAELELAKNSGIKPTSNLVDSVVELGRLKVSITSVKWDNQEGFLPCCNGVLDVTNRVLLPHSPEFYFTTKLDYDYDPAADCPNFKRVIHDAIPNAEKFLQEFAGYALTSDTSHELAIWLYGPSGSGKSSILIGLQSMLGSRAGILGLAEIERSRFALTNLIGKTLIISTEQPSISVTRTHYVNAIISGETIPVEWKFRDPIEIEPIAKIAWAMNELPVVKDTGNGVFRRIKVIRFPALDAAKQDRKVKEAIKKEGAGILNWALDGHKRLMKRGYFEIPACVKDATDDFRLYNDGPRMFVDEKCIVGDGEHTKSSDLYNAYRMWCIANGQPIKSNTSIGEEWKRLCFTKYQSNGHPYWRGVGLRS